MFNSLNLITMPQVKGKKYPYTKAGKKAARKAKRATRKATRKSR